MSTTARVAVSRRYGQTQKALVDWYVALLAFLAIQARIILIDGYGWIRMDTRDAASVAAV